MQKKIYQTTPTFFGNFYIFLDKKLGFFFYLKKIVEKNIFLIHPFLIRNIRIRVALVVTPSTPGLHIFFLRALFDKWKVSR